MGDPFAQVARVVGRGYARTGAMAASSEPLVGREVELAKLDRVLDGLGGGDATCVAIEVSQARRGTLAVHDVRRGVHARVRGRGILDAGLAGPAATRRVR
jgi:hypothetical protein